MACLAAVRLPRRRPMEIDNPPAARALRGVALDRNNSLFLGSDTGGERASAIYSLMETAKLGGLDTKPA